MSDTIKDKLKRDLEESLKNGIGPKAARMALSFLGGIIPLLVEWLVKQHLPGQKRNQKISIKL